VDVPAAVARSARPQVGTAAAIVRWAQAAAQARWFRAAVATSIALTAIVVALETDRGVMRDHGDLIHAVHGALIAALAAELAIRVAARGAAWPQFFRDPWSCFDAIVLVASLVPAIGAGATLARVARVLRVARVVTFSPKLRLIIATMLRSIPSLGHVAALLALLVFVYAVLGVHLFRDVDPVHWGTLPAAMLTLFQILTLDGWVELQRAAMESMPSAWVFYGSYVLIAVFVVVNLFVAVVIANLDQARRELGEVPGEPALADVLAEVRALRAEVAARAAPAATEPRAASRAG
jgi:voltage-gated sodium channel